jgi:hypothetical protein
MNVLALVRQQLTTYFHFDLDITWMGWFAFERSQLGRLVKNKIGSRIIRAREFKDLLTKFLVIP